MQSGLPFKNSTHPVKCSDGGAGALSKTHVFFFPSPLLTWIVEEKKNFFFSHQNVITYACITIRIRYANQFGIILLAANDIYLIIANIGIFPLYETSF